MLAEGATLASMLLLGLLGTGHCLGMCGPLVLALPGTGRGLLTHLAYHLGRITTYAIVGGVVAALGAGLRQAAVASDEDPLGSVTRLQVVLSVVSAALLLTLGLTRLGIIREPKIMASANPARLPAFNRVRKQSAKKGAPPATFVLGLLLGLLPCGLSYAAFARALTAESPLVGASLTLAFGVGTLPGLLLLGTGVAAFARRHRRLFELLAGVLLVGMAISLGLDAFVAAR